MKTRLPFSGSCAVLLVAAGLSIAQTVPTAQPTPPPIPAEAAGATQPVVQLNATQIDDLMGPIALYPDPLIAQILPAATFPTDIVLAARMVARGASRQELDSQEWDASVKALSNYPSIIKMMDERLDWTQQLGAAFAQQPDDVMNSIQRLRSKARTLGHLQDTPQQQVIVEEAQPQTTVVRIVPASTQVVYVPTYDPAVVYYEPYRVSYVSSPYIWFGAGFAIGAWLNMDCDWYARRCYYPSWSWSYCAYPSWGFHFGWGSSYRYYDCNRRYWCGPSYSRYCGPSYYYSDRVASRTNDAHFRSWSRDNSRPAPHLRASYRGDDWASNRFSSSRGNVPGHRRTLDKSPDLRTDIGRPDRISTSARSRAVDERASRGVTTDNLRRTPDASRRALAPDSTRRNMSPDQIRDRLSRPSTPSARRDPSPRANTSPRTTDRAVPGVAPRESSPRVNDSLRRTRQLPPATTGRGNNRGNNGAITVPGSGDVRGRPAVRTVTPSRPSASPSNRSGTPRASSPAPSTGRRGLSVRPSSGGSTPSRRSVSPSSSPSRQVAPRSSSPSRSAAPASRSSSPGHRRSR